jgi:hypothetical protein
MRLIARADDELYGLASVAAKLGRTGKLLDRLGEAHRSRPDDPEPAFAHALAQMAMLPSIGVEFEAHARFGEIIDAFGQVLAIEPRHWLARYSRARLRALIPSSYGAFTAEVSGELTGAAEDLDDLLAYQAEVEWMPYFASSHALAAMVGHLSGATDRCAAHLAELWKCPPVRVGLPVLGALLCEPLVTLYATSVEPDRQRLGDLMTALYGNQPVVIGALARQPQPSGSMP